MGTEGIQVLNNSHKDSNSKTIEAGQWRFCHTAGQKQTLIGRGSKANHSLVFLTVMAAKTGVCWRNAVTIW